MAECSYSVYKYISVALEICTAGLSYRLLLLLTAIIQKVIIAVFSVINHAFHK